jgi:hypothetical protein
VQKFTPRASATVGVGVNAVQSDSAAGAGVALPAGPFLTLTPAVELDYDRPQLEQSLTYSFTANLQFNPDFSLSSGNATYANRAAYQAHAYLTPTVDALFGVAVTEAPGRSTPRRRRRATPTTCKAPPTRRSPNSSPRTGAARSRARSPSVCRST